MNVTIRKMESSDIPKVAELEAVSFSEPWTEQGFQDAIDQTQNIFVVAEDQEGNLLGYCGLYTSFEDGDITNVAVNPTYRKLGIGNRIIEQVKDMAMDQGVERIFLEVRLSNHAAQQLYLKNGFEPCGIRKNFYQKPKEDALLMCATLIERTE